MKFKNLLLLALTLLYGTAFSQLITFSTSDTVAVSAALTDSTQVSDSYYVYVTNAGHSDTIGWKAVVINDISAFQIDYCNELNCYTFGYGYPYDSAAHYFAADSASAYSTDFTVSPSCTAGTGELQVWLWLKHDSAASARALTFLPTYTGACSAAAIQQTYVNGYSIYPSPVNSELSVEGLSNLSNIKISLYDIIGNTVLQNTYMDHGNQVTLNTANLNAGIYFLALESGGKRILTRRVEKLN